VNTKINRVPVEQIKLESQDQAPPVKGLLTLDQRPHRHRQQPEALVDTLNGNASFTINDGVLLNANLEQQLCQAIATLNRKPQRRATRQGHAVPGAASSLTFRNGVASNPDLKARIPA
jgi:AsmA protein